MRQGSGAWRRGLWRLFRPGRYAAAARQQQELDGRLAEAARVLGLTEMLGRRPAQLSGGEQQRVALGRALVRRPAAFLLDEPLSNLDPSLRHELRRQLHLLQRRLRATMIHVTHDQVEAMTLGDQVVVLDGGKVQQAGPPGTLYAQPANRFVAGFIGWPPMNFLEGALQRNDAGNVVFAAGDCCLPLPRERGLQSALRPDTMVTAGIRPEYVRLAGAVAKTKQGPRLSMEVLLIESLGSSSLVTLEHGSWQLLAQVERQLPVRERQTVEVLVDMDKIHWFDRINGQALSSIPAG
jgi:multiple sugar transport system ATP-binding protein